MKQNVQDAQRKVRGLRALAGDPGATAPERAAAAAMAEAWSARWGLDGPNTPRATPQDAVRGQKEPIGSVTITFVLGGP